MSTLITCAYEKMISWQSHFDHSLSPQVQHCTFTLTACMPWLLKIVVGDEFDVAENKCGDAENSGTSERIRLLPGGDNFIRIGRKCEKIARARVYGQKCHYLSALRNDWRKIRRLHKQNIARLVIRSLDVQVHTSVLIIRTLSWNKISSAQITRETCITSQGSMAKYARDLLHAWTHFDKHLGTIVADLTSEGMRNIVSHQFQPCPNRAWMNPRSHCCARVQDDDGEPVIGSDQANNRCQDSHGLCYVSHSLVASRHVTRMYFQI